MLVSQDVCIQFGSSEIFHGLMSSRFFSRLSWQWSRIFLFSGLTNKLLNALTSALACSVAEAICLNDAAAIEGQYGEVERLAGWETGRLRY